jgi:hypothetical protein
MWLVGWGPETVYGIYPKGSMGGLQAEDLGKVLIDDGTGEDLLAWVTEWTWKFGLCVRDWRYVSRLCNIDTGQAASIDPSADSLIPAMIEMYNRLYDAKMGKPAFYCNRLVYTLLWNQAREAVKNSTLTTQMVEGQPVLSFMGIPVRRTDGITNTEAVVA